MLLLLRSLPIPYMYIPVYVPVCMYCTCTVVNVNVNNITYCSCKTLSATDRYSVGTYSYTTNKPQVTCVGALLPVQYE